MPQCLQARLNQAVAVLDCRRQTSRSTRYQTTTAVYYHLY
jgi:hypothetical protein